MLSYYKDLFPKVDETAFIDPSAQVVGDVRIGKHSSVWHNASLRGDLHYIQIGNYTNIQDCSVVHVIPELHPVNIGDYVTVGHGAILHGCTINDGCLIGMGAILLDGSVIEENALVGAGSLVPERKRLKGGWIYVGSPAKPVRALSDEELKNIRDNTMEYVQMAAEYLKALKERKS